MTIHTLLLVRHGEASASWGEHNDPGLSKEGQNQAHALIDYYAKDDLNKYNFISSPKRRALETSQPLAKFYNKDVIACKAFSEIPSDNIPNERKQEWLKKIMLQEQIMLPVGVMQGRLSPIKGDRIQSFPWQNWRRELYCFSEMGFERIE